MFVRFYLQQEVEDEAQKWMIVLFVFVLLHILLLLLFLRFWCRLKTRGKPGNKLDDVFNSRFAPVHDHGVLQVVDKLLVEPCLVLQLKDETNRDLNAFLQGDFKHLLDRNPLSSESFLDMEVKWCPDE